MVVGAWSSMLTQESTAENASAAKAPESTNQPAKPAADAVDPEFTVSKSKNNQPKTYNKTKGKVLWLTIYMITTITQQMTPLAVGV